MRQLYLSQKPEYYSVGKLYLMLLLVCSSLLISFYLGSEEREAGYEQLYLLPFVYAVIMIVFHKYFKYSFNSLGLSVFNGIEFIRYVFTPWFMVYTGFYGSTYYPNPTYDAKSIAVYIMLYELIAEYTLAYFLLRNVLSRPQRQHHEHSTTIKTYEHRWLLFLAAVILIVFSTLTNFSGNNYRYQIFGYFSPDTGSNYVLGELALQCSTVLIFMFVSLPALMKYVKTRNVYYAAQFLCASILFVGINFGDVRLFFVIKALIVISLILKYFRKISRIILIILIVFVAFVSILVMTLDDENASHGLFYLTGTDSERDTYAYTLQKYFSGPYNQAKSVDLKNSNIVPIEYNGIELLLNDISNNTFPLTLLKIDPMNTTKIMFNYLLYSNHEKATQIIPLAGQGMLYFGYLAAPFPTLFLYGLLCILERRKSDSAKEQSCYHYVALTFYILYLGCMHMYNISIISGMVINVLFPVHLIVLLQEKLIRMRNRDENFVCDFKPNKWRRRTGASLHVE
ncbi:hypothetical protein [Cohnella kolymensis]|nr:hypothetical protein [Cohnella kolymensis]